MHIYDWCHSIVTGIPLYTVGANRLERRRRKISFLKSLYLWSQSRYWSAVFFKSSLMVLGILIENFSSAALTIFAWGALQKSYFLPLFSPFFVKYTMVVVHFDIFIENNFFGCLCNRRIEKKFRKKFKFFGHEVNLKFYQISDCPTLRAFIQYL
jgi:hypothetical protein